MKVLRWICVLAITPLVFIGTNSAQTLKADYQFQGDLVSSVAGAPALSNLTGSGGSNSFVNDVVDGYTRQTLRFPLNSGFSLNVVGLVPSNSYTFVGLFRLDNVTGRRRVAGGDPNDVDANDGAYIADGRLEGENAANAPFRPNHYIQLVVVRESNGTVRAYRDGTLRVTANDFAGDFILDPVQRYFQDDNIVPNEASAGNIARFRIYDGPMTTVQVQALDRMSNATGSAEPALLFHSSRDGNFEIYSMNADGSNTRRLTNNGLLDAYPRWSPDRNTILFSRVESNLYRVWKMNPDGTGQVRLTNTAAGDYKAVWRPDGQKIFFSRCVAATGLCDIYTMDPDGANAAPLTLANSANDEDHITFSRDGSKIAFICSVGTSFSNQNICVANSDGSGRQQVTNTVSPVINEYPEFSPDGTKIAFTRRSTSAGSTSEIYTMNLNGSGLTQLTTNSFFDHSPIWSPDGSRLVFTSEREAAFTEVYTMNSSNGSDVQRLTVSSVADVASDWYHQPIQPSSAPFDYDGDGRTDISVFRPVEGAWYIFQSLSQSVRAQGWGLNGDRVAPADFDGDGKTDLAVFRESDSNWYIFNSLTNTATVFGWGIAGDLPVPADYNGDQKADIVVYRPSESNWYRKDSDGQINIYAWGILGDKPAPADFNGDGVADMTVFRPSEGKWFTINSGNASISQGQWGINGDIPIPADYSGDGKADFCVFRPSDQTWYRIHSNDFTIHIITWGLPGDLPVPGDYDGDGRSDLAVFRPSNATWFLNTSTSGIYSQPFGLTGDKPTPNAFVY